MKTQLEICDDYLRDAGCFTGDLPSIVKQISSVASQDVHTRMGATVAVSELMTFTSHLRKPIQLDKETLVPVNAISFVLAPSGAEKDKTVKSIRKVFKHGYQTINDIREGDARTKAILEARHAGREDPESFAVYQEFYEKPPILFSGISTEQGLFKHCNKLERANLGAGFIFASELATELQTNPNIITNMKLASILYDVGQADVTLLKGEEGQLEPIENLPVNALFMGSYDLILYDESIKKKLKQEFTSKLARRGFVTFIKDEVEPKSYDSAQSIIDDIRHMNNRGSLSLESLQKAVDESTKYNLQGGKKNVPLTISDEAYNLYIIFQKWGKEKSKTLKIDYPISKITIQHRYWAALKLAGAFAIIANEDEITKTNYVDAINYIDFLSEDLPAFEDELRKDVFEQFIDYMHSIVDNGKAEAEFHSLLKKEYVSKGGDISTKVKHLLKLANSKDKLGIYTISETSVTYEKTVITDTVGVSFIQVPEKADKQTRGITVANGVLTHTEGTFKDLRDLLEMDVAYASFEFRDGKRKADNLIPTTKWITLDVDDGVVSDEVAHEMLNDINHHISRTSDPDNPMKYRILIELDAAITLEPRQWKKFMEGVENYLSIPLDKLPMSQIYYSWSGREVLSVTNKEPLATKDLLLIATEVEEDTNYIDVSKLNKKQKEEALHNKQDLLWYLYECESQCSRAMIKAAWHMARLGASVADIESTLRHVNFDFWVMPMQERRFKNTILSQLEAIVRKVQ